MNCNNQEGKENNLPTKSGKQGSIDPRRRRDPGDDSGSDDDGIAL